MKVPQAVDFPSAVSPRKLLERLKDYVRINKIGMNDGIFPISYVAARPMVKKAGIMVAIELRPHELKRHVATYASSTTGSDRLVGP